MNWKLFVLASSIYIVFENLQKKGAFNIASEASCTYILSVQKFMKNTQNILFQRVFENLILWSNSVTRQVNFKKTKIGGKCQNWKRTNATFWIIFKHCGVVQANGFQVLFLQISSKSLNPLSGGGGGSSTSWCSSWLPCYHDKRSLSILFFYALKVPPPHTPLQKIWWKP